MQMPHDKRAQWEAGMLLCRDLGRVIEGTRNESRGLMSASEWIWTKIGFGLLAAFAGAVWGLVFYPFVSAVDPDVSLMSVLGSFVGTFFGISLVNEKWIGKAGLGAIFTLCGAVYGIFAMGGIAPSNLSWREHGKELAVCLGVGMVSVLFVLLW